MKIRVFRSVWRYITSWNIYMQGENIQLTLVEATELKTFGLRVFFNRKTVQEKAMEVLQLYTLP